MADYSNDPFLSWFHGYDMPMESVPPPLEVGGGMGGGGGMLGGPLPPPPPPPPPVQSLVIPTLPGLVPPSAPPPLPPTKKAHKPDAAPAIEPEVVPTDAAPAILGEGLHPLTDAPVGAPTPPPPDTRAPADPYGSGGSIGGLPAGVASDALTGGTMSPFDMPDEVAGAKALADLWQTDPERAAMLMAQREDAKRQKFAAKEHELALQQKEEAERNWNAYRAANEATDKRMAAIEADSKALASKKMDPDRWYKNQSTFGTIASVAMGIIGGLVQGRTGSPTNQGLEMIRQSVDNDINAQKMDIENGQADLTRRQGIVAQEFAKHGDLFRATEAARAASYERAIQSLESEMRNYDPKGTFVANGSQLIMGMRRDQQTAFANAHKAALDEATTVATLEGKRLDNMKKAQGLMGGGAGAAPGFDMKKVRPVEELLPVLNLSKEDVAGLPTNISGDQLTKLVGERQKIGRGKQEIQKGEQTYAAEERDVHVAIPWGGELEGRDGKPYKAPNGTEAKEMRQKLHAANQIVSMIDEVRDIRDHVGGESSLVNSPEYQRLVVLQSRLQNISKEGTQGMSSDEDMKSLRAAAGADNISSFRSQAAKLDEARRRTLAELNSYLGSKDVGTVIDIPDPYEASARGKHSGIDTEIKQEEPSAPLPSQRYRR